MEQDWIELLSEAVGEAGCPVRMRAEWLSRQGPLACPRCAASIRAGELFLACGRCAMGGDVELGPRAALYSDVLELRAYHLRCAEPRPEEPTCLTIGHSTRPQEALFDLIEQQGVRVLADIRTVPRSRHNPQYNTEALAEGAKARGICYLHLAGLGGLRHPRKDSPNTGWRNSSFRGYADYMQTEGFEGALLELIDLLRWRRTAIMCAEAVPWRCHRSLVADALSVRGIPTFHLMEGGARSPHRLTDFAVVEGERIRYPASQGELFPPG